jgi:hypothetical protein
MDAQVVRPDHPALLALVGATVPITPSIVTAMTAFHEEYTRGGNPLDGLQILWWRHDAEAGDVSIIARDQEGQLSLIGFDDEPAYGRTGYVDIAALADWFDRFGDGDKGVAQHLRTLAAESPWKSDT